MKKTIIYLHLFFLIFVSCETNIKELTEGNELQRVSTKSNVEANLSGEKNPKVGERTYIYKLSYSKLKNAASINISFTGSARPFIKSGSNYYTNLNEVYLKSGSTGYEIEVVWTQEARNATLIVTAHNTSIIKINASLAIESVTRNPVNVTYTSPIELGSTVHFTAPYELINVMHRAIWNYDSKHFTKIDESESPSLSKYQLSLRVDAPFAVSNVDLDINEIIQYNGTDYQYPVRKASTRLFRVGPEITGSQNCIQYNTYDFELSEANNISNITWEDNTNIDYIGDRDKAKISICPLTVGTITIKVSYNYKNRTERYTSTYELNVSSKDIFISGPDYICGSDVNGVYNVNNLPVKSTVNWSVENSGNITLYQDTPYENYVTVQKPNSSMTLVLNASVILSSGRVLNYKKKIKVVSSNIQHYAVATYPDGRTLTYQPYTPIPLNQTVKIMIYTAPDDVDMKLVTNGTLKIDWDYNIPTKILTVKIVTGTVGPIFSFAFDHRCYSSKEFIFRAGSVP